MSLGGWKGKDAQGNPRCRPHLWKGRFLARVAMRELLQQLSDPVSYAGMLATSGERAPALLESRNQLRQHIRDARSWRERLNDDEFVGDYSTEDSSSDSDSSDEDGDLNVAGEGRPSDDDRQAASDLLVFWDALNRLEAAHAGEAIEAPATSVRPTLVDEYGGPGEPVGRRQAVRFAAESIHSQPARRYTHHHRSGEADLEDR